MVLSDSLSVYTQPHNGPVFIGCVLHGSPRFYKVSSADDSLLLCKETWRLKQQLKWCFLLPHCALSFHHHRLFIHHSHFAIISSLLCSSCHFWFKHFGCSRGSSHTEDAESKYLCPFLVLVCAISSLLAFLAFVMQRHKLPGCKSTVLVCFHPMLCSKCNAVLLWLLQGFLRCIWNKRKSWHEMVYHLQHFCSLKAKEKARKLSAEMHNATSEHLLFILAKVSMLILLPCKHGWVTALLIKVIFSKFCCVKHWHAAIISKHSVTLLMPGIIYYNAAQLGWKYTICAMGWKWKKWV